MAIASASAAPRSAPPPRPSSSAGVRARPETRGRSILPLKCQQVRRRPPSTPRRAAARKNSPGGGVDADTDAVTRHRPLEARRVVDKRRLAQRHRPRHQVHGGRDVIPPPRRERRARGDQRGRGPAADEQRERAGLVEQEREAARAILGPGPHDDLPARLGPDGHAGGLDEGLEREAGEARRRPPGARR